MSEYATADQSRRTEILIALSSAVGPDAIAMIESAAGRESPGLLWEWAEAVIDRNVVELYAAVDRFLSREAEFQRDHWAWRNDDPAEWNRGREQSAARFSRLREVFEERRRAGGAATLIATWFEKHAQDEPHDFTILHELLAKSDAATRRAAWEHVAGRFQRSGRRQLANKCAVQALLCHPSSAAVAWRIFEFHPDDRVPTDLAERVRRFPRPMRDRDQSGVAQLIVRLRKVVGAL